MQFLEPYNEIDDERVNAEAANDSDSSNDALQVVYYCWEHQGDVGCFT